MDKITNSVSERERESFDAMSSFWWNPEGEIVGLYEQKAQFILPFMLKGLSKTNVIKDKERMSKKALENLKILDVGCGGGFLSEDLANLKADVTALDPSEKLIFVAKDHANMSGLNINYSTDAVEKHCIDCKEKYDVVACIEVLDHVTDVRSVLKSSIQALKPGGTLFVSTINRTFLAWFVVIFLYEYVFGIVPRGTHHMHMFVKPKEVEDILKEYGCKVVEVKGSWYSVFSKVWIALSTHQIFYALCAVKEDEKKIK
jgi:polyprenyldihydroxybenzoate methyltransferase / 3-demethylubiquinol 3-O-methyltransferase